jgi:hypothetical protein
MACVRFRHVIVASMLLLGCSSKPSGPPHEKTYPVVGAITVDGQPASGVAVTFNPEGDTPLKFRSSIATDGNGRFSMSTYQKNDGMPAGTYVLTFEWARGLSEGGIQLGKEAEKLSDKLNGAYLDPKKSQHKITVSADKNDLGVIELSTKDSTK